MPKPKPLNDDYDLRKISNMEHRRLMRMYVQDVPTPQIKEVLGLSKYQYTISLKAAKLKCGWVDAGKTRGHRKGFNGKAEGQKIVKVCQSDYIGCSESLRRLNERLGWNHSTGMYV